MTVSGQLQYDMWGVTPTDLWDWAELKAKVAKHGVRNSLLLAPMPTASTAQILGNNESFEPYTNNIYSRRVLSGEFQVGGDFLPYFSPSLTVLFIYSGSALVYPPPKHLGGPEPKKRRNHWGAKI